MVEVWHLKGDYFENCTCDLLCPCILTKGRAQPTQGYCGVVLAYHIEEGHYGQLRLDGLNFAIAYYTPGPMANQQGKLAVYIDERADAAQRRALASITRGEAGGRAAILPRVVTPENFLGIRYVPIAFEKEGQRRRVIIAGIADMTVHGVIGDDRQGPIWLENVAHPVADRLAIAVAGEHSTYCDYGFIWDNSGKNGHYASFDWQGP